MPLLYILIGYIEIICSDLYENNKVKTYHDTMTRVISHHATHNNFDNINKGLYTQ